MLLGLDVITSSDVQGTLDKVEGTDGHPDHSRIAGRRGRRCGLEDHAQGQGQF